MSLEQQIADLVATGGSMLNLPSVLTGVAQTQISLVVAAFQQRAAGMRQMFYVHQANGDDANSGAVGSPLKSIGKALLLTAPGGVCQVVLQADFVTPNSEIVVENRLLEIMSDGSNKWSFTPACEMKVISGTTYRIMNGFSLIYGGAIYLHNIALVMPDVSSVPGSSGVAPQGGACLIKPSGFTDVRPYVAIRNCDVNMPTSPFGPLLAWNNSPLALNAGSLTMTGQATDMNGRWLPAPNNNTAGIAANTINWLVTNLTTI